MSLLSFHVPLSRSSWLWVSLFSLVLFTTAGCGGGQPDYPVQSYLEGTLTVAAEVDSTSDYSGFEISIVSAAEGADIDTLGYAMTDRSGFFAMDIKAAEKGIYPIEIRRNDRTLARSQYVLANNDSALFNMQFPARNSLLMIRSRENGAWLAYRNTKALHNQRLLEVSQKEGATLADVETVIKQTSQIFWTMSDTYPGTMGTELARSESIVMQEGWDDSLVVDRAHQIKPEEAGYLNVVQALRRSTARVHGLQAAMDTLDARKNLDADSERIDALSAEQVMALMDSSQVDKAREHVRMLANESTSEEWKAWGQRVLYELENLMPGMAAPNASFTDLSGRELDLTFFFDVLTLIEFIDPATGFDPAEKLRRDNLLALSDGTNFQVITISVNPDPAYNELYLDNRSTSEAYVIAEEGLESDLATTYNVNSLPKRLLVNNGVIVSKYTNSSVSGIRQDVLAVINQNNPS